MSGKPCPLMGWETVKMAQAAMEQAKVAATSAQLTALLSAIDDPIAKGLIDCVDSGRGFQDAVLGAVEDMINSIDGSTWMMYALSKISEDIYAAAGREIAMLRTIRSLIDKSIKKNKKQSQKYARLSRMAVDNANRIRGHLLSVMNTGSSRNAARIVRGVINIANTNVDILRGRPGKVGIPITGEEAIGTIKYMSEGDPLKKIGGVAKNETEEVLRAISNVAIGDTLEALGRKIDKYLAISRIMYMYSGINLVKAVYEIKNRHDEIVRLSRNPAAAGYLDKIDKSLGDLSRDTKNVASKMWNEYKRGYGFYLLSMSPEYDIYDKTISGKSPETDQYNPNPHYIGSALMTVGANSPIDANTLTVYGASMRIATCINSFNALAEIAIASGASDDKSNDPSEPLENIKDLAAHALFKVIPDEYVFDDGAGMAAARSNAISLYEYLRNKLRIPGVNLDRSKISEEKMKGLRGAYRIDVNLSEPAMGAKIVMGFILPAILIPGFSASSITKEIQEMVSDRIAYLTDIMSKVKPIMGYRDASCEKTISYLNAAGLSGLASALQMGDIVGGVATIASATIGGGGILYEIYDSCINGKADISALWNKLTTGKMAAKRKMDKAMRMAAESVLKKFGHNMSVIDTITITRRKMTQSRESIDRLLDMIGSAR